MPPPASTEAPYGSHQFADRLALTGWFGKLVDLIGRDNLKELHDKYGPLPDFERPKGGYRQRIIHLVRDNIKAGITVSLVSIPLALSLSVSSGATPGMGLASAIWGGLFAGLLGGSQFNIAGPTASGSGILAVYSLRYGYQILPFISILSGVMMLIALMLRLDKYVLLLPTGVMHGWTLGVAFTIAGNQLGSAFGVTGLKRHEQFYLNAFEVLSHLKRTQVGPFFIFLIAVIFIVTLGLFRPKIPWTIIVALTGIFLGVLSSYDAWFFHMDTLYDRFPGLKFNLFQTPTFKSTFFTGEIITASFSIAFISILESLLSAKIADSITNTRFAQPLEVFGIAVANLVAGIFNGVPVTAALARTTLNVNSGATNRMAAILNAICCGVIAIALIRVLGFLPMCIIAALLVNVAIRMVNVQNWTHLWLHDSTMFRIAIFTAFVTVFMDPAQGIIYGAVISIFLHGLRTSEAWSEITAANDTVVVVTHSSVELDRQGLQDTFERQFPPTKREDDENAVEMEAIGAQGAAGGAHRDDHQIPLDAPVVIDGVAEVEDPESDYDDEEEELARREQNRFFITAPKYKADHIVTRFPGELTYLNAEQHADRLAPLLSTGRFVILHLRRTYYIDMDGMDLLTSIVRKVEKSGRRIIVSGLTAQILPNLEVMEWFIRAREEDRIVANYKDAVRKIREIDREDQRREDERNYHDITSYELEESRRHSDYLASMERARQNREEFAAKMLAEEAERKEAEERKQREEEEARKAEIAARQARLDAKRKADAEEFQKRLIEFERKKKENEEARLASLAAIASSSIVGEPSLSIPHHSDHTQLARSSSLLGLKVIADTLEEPASDSEEQKDAPAAEEQKDDHVDSVVTVPDDTVVNDVPHVEEKANEEEIAEKKEEESHKQEEAGAHESQAEPHTDAAESAVHEPKVDESNVVSYADDPMFATDDTNATLDETTEQKESAVDAPVEEPAVPHAEEVHAVDDSKEEDVSEPKEELTASAEEEPHSPHIAELPGASDGAHIDESAISTHDDVPHHENNVHDMPPATDDQLTDMTSSADDLAPEAETDEPVASDAPQPHAPLEKSHSASSVQGGLESTTPPPESETSSMASDGPRSPQISPRRVHPEPQAPLDVDDPFSQEPEIPTTENAAVDDADAAQEPTHEETHEAAPQESHAPAPAEPTAPTTVAFLDPFAEFEDDSMNTSTASMPSQHAASAPSTPAKSIGHVDYIDPFDQFGVIPDEPTPSTSVHSTPQKPAAPAPVSTDIEFDPFADILSSEAPATHPKDANESDEELLL